MRQKRVSVRTLPKVKAVLDIRPQARRSTICFKAMTEPLQQAVETLYPDRSVPVPWKCGTGLTYLSTEARMEGSEGILLFKEEFGSRSQVSSCPRSLPVVVAAYFKMLMIEY